jgi:site-specific DNA-cytosine methylase
VELCSCLGSFTNKLVQLGGELVGYAEPTEEPVQLFKHKFPDAEGTSSLYNTDKFEEWKDKHGQIDLLMLGPSCKSFSAAGKQDWGNPRAKHAPDSAKAARIMQPMVVTLEITKELQSMDSNHGLYTETMEQYSQAGYSLASAELVRDSEIGGCQSRLRLFITWDRADIHDRLPPIPPMSSYSRTPCPIRFALAPLNAVPNYVWLMGKVNWINASTRDQAPLYPQQVATITWGGPDTAIRAGSIVCQDSTQRFWRVTIAQVDGQLTVTTPDDPQHTAVSKMHSDEVTHHPQTVKVYSIDGVSVPIKTWGEGLEGAGMLINDTRKGPRAVRPLLPIECWQLQGKPMADWQYLRHQLGVPPRRCSQLCGEGVPLSLASAAAQRAFSRVQQCKQLLAKAKTQRSHSSKPDNPRDANQPEDKRPGPDNKGRTPPPKDKTDRVVTIVRGNEAEGRSRTTGAHDTSNHASISQVYDAVNGPLNTPADKVISGPDKRIDTFPPVIDTFPPVIDTFTPVSPVDKVISMVSPSGDLLECHTSPTRKVTSERRRNTPKSPVDKVISMVSPGDDLLGYHTSTAGKVTSERRRNTPNDQPHEAQVQKVTSERRKDEHNDHPHKAKVFDEMKEDDTLCPAMTGPAIDPPQWQCNSHSMVRTESIQQEPTTTKAVLLILDSRDTELSKILLHNSKETWWCNIAQDLKENNARGVATKAFYDNIKRSWPYVSSQALTYSITMSGRRHKLHVICTICSSPPSGWSSLPISDMPHNSWWDEATLSARAKMVSFGFNVDYSPTVHALSKAGNISFTKAPTNTLKQDELSQVGATPMDSTQLLKAYWQHQQRLREALLDTPSTDPDANMLHSWAAQIGTSIPEEILQLGKKCKALPLPTSEQHALAPLSSPFSAPTTAKLPKQQQRRAPPEGFQPTSIADILTEEGVEMLNRMQQRAMQRHQAIQRKQRPQRNDTDLLVIGQEQIRPAARDIVWDLRSLRDACHDSPQCPVIKPLDFDAPIETHLNRTVLASELSDFPDQEVLGMLLDGAQFKADIPHQVAILPHLSSLTYGFESVEKELLKMQEMGWYTFHDTIPFIPWRALPQGSTSRKYEPERARRTTDGGGPRYLLYDSQGQDVTPINVSCHGGSGVKPIKRSQYWPQEIKPSLEQLMNDITVLNYSAGQVFHEEIFSGTDDVFSFFNQIKLAPSELWKTGLHWGDLSSNSNQQGTFIVERVLGFGLSPNSNIAQRFANAIVYIFYNRFDSIEEEFFAQETDPRCRHWIATRKAMGPGQCRLYALKMYTDDAKFVVVGIKRLIRFLRCWDKLMNDLGLMMAIAQKRQLGCATTWLGFLPCPMMCLVTIPRNKIATAITGLNTLAIGLPMQFDAYRSLLGFLEHLIPFDSSGRSSMFGFYRIFKDNPDMSPAQLVYPPPQVQSQSRLKMEVLTQHPFVSTLQANLNCASNLLNNKVQAVAFVYTDAAKDDCTNPSIAGYLYGRWWSIPVNEKLHLLPIAALEFLAIIVSFILFHKYLQPYPAIVFSTDSQVSAMVIASDNARSTVTQRMQTLLRSLSEYHDLSMRTFVSTVHGVGNIMGDGYSRSKHKAMKAVTAELGVRTTRLSIPPRVWAIVNINFTDPDQAIGMASEDHQCCGVQLMGEAFDLPLDTSVELWKSHIMRHLTAPIRVTTANSTNSFSNPEWRHANLTNHLQRTYSVFYAMTRTNSSEAPEPDLSHPGTLLAHIIRLESTQKVMPTSIKLMAHLYYVMLEENNPVEVTLMYEQHSPDGILLPCWCLRPPAQPQGQQTNMKRVHLILSNNHWMTFQQYSALDKLPQYKVPYAVTNAETEEAHECHELLLTSPSPDEGTGIPAPTPDGDGLTEVAAVFNRRKEEVCKLWMIHVRRLLSSHSDSKEANDIKLAYADYVKEVGELTNTNFDFNVNCPQHMLLYIELLAKAECYIVSTTSMRHLFNMMAARTIPAPTLVLMREEGNHGFGTIALESDHPVTAAQYAAYLVKHGTRWDFLPKYVHDQQPKFSITKLPSPITRNSTMEYSIATPNDSSKSMGAAMVTMSWHWYEGYRPDLICGLTEADSILKLEQGTAARCYDDMLLRSGTLFNGYHQEFTKAVRDLWTTMRAVRATTLRSTQPLPPWMHVWNIAVDMASGAEDRTALHDGTGDTLHDQMLAKLPPAQRVWAITTAATKLRMCLAQGVAPLSPPLMRFLLAHICKHEGLPMLTVRMMEFQQGTKFFDTFRTEGGPDCGGRFSRCVQLQLSRRVSGPRVEEVGTLTLLKNHWTGHDPSNQFSHFVYDTCDLIHMEEGATALWGTATNADPPQPCNGGTTLHRTMDPPDRAMIAASVQLEEPWGQDCGAQIIAQAFRLHSPAACWTRFVQRTFSANPADPLQQREIQRMLYDAHLAYHADPQQPNEREQRAQFFNATQTGWMEYYCDMAEQGVIPLSPVLMKEFYFSIIEHEQELEPPADIVLMWHPVQCESPLMRTLMQSSLNVCKLAPYAWSNNPDTEFILAYLNEGHWFEGIEAVSVLATANIAVCNRRQLWRTSSMVGTGKKRKAVPALGVWGWYSESAPLLGIRPAYTIPNHCGLQLLVRLFHLNLSTVTAEWLDYIDEAFAVSPCEDGLLAALSQQWTVSALEAWMHWTTTNCPPDHLPFELALAEQAIKAEAPDAWGLRARIFKQLARAGIVPLTPILMCVLYRRMEKGHPFSVPPSLAMIWRDPVFCNQARIFILTSTHSKNNRDLHIPIVYCIIDKAHWFFEKHLEDSQLYHDIQKDEVQLYDVTDLRGTESLVGMGTGSALAQLEGVPVNSTVAPTSVSSASTETTPTTTYSGCTPSQASNGNMPTDHESTIPLSPVPLPAHLGMKHFQCCGIYVIADAFNLPYSTVYSAWSQAIHSLRHGSEALRKSIRPLLYEAYRSYEIHNTGNDSQLQRMVRLGSAAEMVYYTNMCDNHIIPISPPLMRTLYAVMSRLKPDITLVIMWERLHLRGSHHDIAYAVASPKNPFANSRRKYVILSGFHWWPWAEFNVRHISDKVRWCRPSVATALGRIGMGLTGSDCYEAPGCTNIACGVSKERCRTPETCYVVAPMPNKLVPPNAQMCTICSVFTHYHCGMSLSQPREAEMNQQPEPNVHPRDPLDPSQVMQQVTQTRTVRRRRANSDTITPSSQEEWWCLDCIAIYQDQWDQPPVVKKGIPPFCSGTIALHRRTFLSNYRMEINCWVAGKEAQLSLGSGILAIARAMEVDSEYARRFVDMSETDLMQIRVGFHITHESVLHGCIPRAIRLLTALRSGVPLAIHQTRMPMQTQEVLAILEPLMKTADSKAQMRHAADTLDLPNPLDAFATLASCGAYPMTPRMVCAVVRAIAAIEGKRVTLVTKVFRTQHGLIWKLRIVYIPSYTKAGMITLSGFKYEGSPPTMCCGEAEWPPPTNWRDWSSTDAWIGLDGPGSNQWCGIDSLAGALEQQPECLLNLFTQVLRSQLREFNNSLQVCLDIAYISYAADLDSTGETLRSLQSLMEQGLTATIEYMLSLAEQHIVPTSPPLMKFLYEAYCEQVPVNDISICLIWTVTDNYVAWNYLHPPSPTLKQRKRFILLQDKHWSHLSEYEISMHIPNNPRWYMPNILLYDEWVGAERITDPLFWMLASTIGTGIKHQAHLTHRTNTACAAQALSDALSETFQDIMLVFDDFLAELSDNFSTDIFELVATSLVVYHGYLPKHSEEQGLLHRALEMGAQAVIRYARQLARRQAVPMSPPLLKEFYHFIIQSPRLSHKADKEICLIWKNPDGSMARTILHPVQPFRTCDRTFIVLANTHYSWVPDNMINQFIPGKAVWSEPRLEDYAATIGLGCLSKLKPSCLTSCCPPKPEPNNLQTSVTNDRHHHQDDGSGNTAAGTDRGGGPHLSSPLTSRKRQPPQQQQHFTRPDYLAMEPTRSRPLPASGTLQMKPLKPSVKQKPPRPPLLPGPKLEHEPSQANMTVPEQGAFMAAAAGWKPPHTRSRYAIHNIPMATSMESNIDAVVGKGPAILTTREEESHWKKWCEYTAALKTASIRDNTAANSGADPVGHKTELQILRLAPIWIAQNCMEGRKVLSSGATINRPTPQSAIQVVNSVIRIHKRKGITMAKVSWKPILDGMCREYVQEYGVSALQPKHHEPFTREEVDKLTTPPAGLGVTSTLVVGNNIKWHSLRSAMCLSSETGDRKAALSLNPRVPFTIDRMTRDSASYIIKGEHVYDPTEAQLRAMTYGDLAVITSAGDKNDQFGIQWASAPRYLPYGTYNNCTCKSMIAYELAHPCRGPLRKQVPLFSTDTNHSPWLSHDMSNSLRCLQQRLGIKEKSWHSFRVYIACALLATGHEDSTIQAMVHWKTLKALKTYARIEPLQYANSLIQASTAEVSSVQARNLPDIDLTIQLQKLMASPLDGAQEIANYPRCQVVAPSRVVNKGTSKPVRRRRGHLSKDVWKVEKIVRSRASQNGTQEHLIKWAGWPHSANSWEPQSNLIN